MINRQPCKWFLMLCLTTTLWAGAEFDSYTMLWQRAQGPLLSRWTKQVRTTNVLPENPRPQMVRLTGPPGQAGSGGPVWVNLNGMWDYAICARGLDWPGTWEGKMRVPFCVESYLGGVRRYVGPKHQLWYRRIIERPELTNGQRVLLHFGAVDWNTVVYINGEDVDSHKGGYDPFVMDITDNLKAGDNELVVSVWDPTDEGVQPHGRQKNQPGNGFYTPVTGIWQTVWLEVVPQTYIEHLQLTPDVDNQQLLVRLDVCNLKASDGIALKALAQGKEVGAIGLQPEASAPDTDKPKGRFSVELPTPEPDAAVVEPSLDNRIEIAPDTGKAQAYFKLPIESPVLWSPDHPHLYDLHIEIRRASKVVDFVRSYFGMRKIEVKQDRAGYTRLFLNNEALFQYGPLDQGFWPDGLYTAPTDEALYYDIEVTKRLGFNMIRKYQKVEPQRWYYWCDRLGILVWQDMPGAPGQTDPFSDKDLDVSPEQETLFRNEWQAIIKARFNHPCIVVWVPFNQGRGQFKTNEIQRWTKVLDRSRLVDGPSGFNDRGEGDMFDMHYHQGPAMPPQHQGRVSVLGACGGLRYTLQGHLWNEDPQVREQWPAFGTQKQLTDRYEQFVADLQLLIGKGLGGAVLTQMTDLEIATNGLMTYDRAVVKYEADIMQRLHRNLYQTPPFYRVVLASSEQSESPLWRYTTEQPPEQWMQPGFDDLAWQQGKAGFGEKGLLYNQYVSTPWTSGDIWLRRSFALTTIPEGQLVLNVQVDDKVEVYLNGLLVDIAEDIKDMHRFRQVDSPLRKALRIGENLLAVHAHNTEATQFIDVGIIEIVP